MTMLLALTASVVIRYAPDLKPIADLSGEGNPAIVFQDSAARKLVEEACAGACGTSVGRWLRFAAVGHPQQLRHQVDGGVESFLLYTPKSPSDDQSRDYLAVLTANPTGRKVVISVQSDEMMLFRADIRMVCRDASVHGGWQNLCVSLPSYEPEGDPNGNYQYVIEPRSVALVRIPRGPRMTKQWMPRAKAPKSDTGLEEDAESISLDE